MNFVCKEISINDEEFGCTVTLSEKEDSGFDYEETVEEIMNATDQYLMLQKTYGEDEFEEDYYYIESRDFEKSGELEDFEIFLTETEFIITFENEKYVIQISPNRKVFDELKKVLSEFTECKGKLNIQ
ncbi:MULTISPECIES: hypothetical protein [Weeksellaceae]|uniref:Uncharacterized protein n=2 Tax=Weeksellaceae TaxID=2762318 RepID=A0A3G8XV35_9FLAO|nr:hypothetical protein [Kaistella carnis]AZI32026.1 hypothetical protein EIB73_02020 [Kaistella carnis]